MFGFTQLVYIESSASTTKNVSSPFCVLRPVMFRLLHVYRNVKGNIDWMVFFVRFAWDHGWVAIQ